jgi:tetratricopeptide (TPR) repeat protein
MRSYIRSARKVSEHDLKGLFVKVLESTIHHPHLLEELRALYADSKVEDVELAARLEKEIAARLEGSHAPTESESVDNGPAATAPEMPKIETVKPPVVEGLIMLDNRHEDALSREPQHEQPSRADEQLQPPADFSYDFGTGDPGESTGSSGGDGKDHYDLGNVYREMQLWDAAAAEFEQARNDPSLRMRASLAMAECLLQLNNLQGALDILEAESRVGGGSPQERLNLDFQLGLVCEQLGNFREALAHFESVFRQNSRHADAAERIQVLRKRIGVESN